MRITALAVHKRRTSFVHKSHTPENLPPLIFSKLRSRFNHWILCDGRFSFELFHFTWEYLLILFCEFEIQKTQLYLLHWNRQEFLLEHIFLYHSLLYIRPQSNFWMGCGERSKYCFIYSKIHTEWSRYDSTRNVKCLCLLNSWVAMETIPVNTTL